MRLLVSETGGRDPRSQSLLPGKGFSVDGESSADSERESLQSIPLGLIVLSFFLLITLPSAYASDLVSIPGGNFISGSDPSIQSHVTAFSIDKHEVTHAEFSKVFPDHAFRKGAANHPVTSVTWHEAKEYCQRVDKRLPSDAEWEKAARGTDGRLYPWGNKPLKRKPHPYFSGVVKRTVGSNRKDLSPYGVHDMAGSVWEWTSSADGESCADGERTNPQKANNIPGYKKKLPPCPSGEESSADGESCADSGSCADGESNYKIVRGGLWNLHLDFEYSQTHDRIRLPAGERYVFLGFRCARSEK